ncbi:hypothetical protein [Bosea sp. MMO-172]|uniref:hypothetical protein n=1 Tax=Bosea sp. MMO-172 TaxID=3127885 RepID=UPI003015EDA0
MANICYTFEIDGRPAYMAFASEDDAQKRLCRGFDVIENGCSVLRPGSAVSMRPSTRDEIGTFINLAARACLAGRIEWEDVMDGFPIFLIAGADPEFPDLDINTALPMSAPPRPLMGFGIPIEDHLAFYRFAPPPSVPQAA